MADLGTSYSRYVLTSNNVQYAPEFSRTLQAVAGPVFGSVRFYRRLDPLSSSPHERDYLAAASQFVATIRPPRHHLDPLVPEFRTSIGPPYTIAVDVSQLPFDCVGMPETTYVQHR